MSDLSRFQDAFARTVFAGGDAELQPALADPAAAGGLDVYRNNVLTALVDGLAKDYPVVERLVGRDFFRGMAAEHVRNDPPRSAVLTLYGGGFPAFVAAFPPARDLVYLADVARLDRAWIECLFASDSDPLSPDRVGALDDDAFAVARLAPHPSARLIASPHAAYSIWRTNREDDVVTPIAAAGPETALIWKNAGAVRHRRLGDGEAAFLHALFSGAGLSDAAGDALAVEADLDPLLTFASLVAGGVFDSLEGDAA